MASELQADGGDRGRNDATGEAMQHLRDENRQRAGCTASSRAAMMMPISRPEAAARLLRIASTSAPAGNWLTSEVIVPNVRAKPISTCVHLCVVR